MAKEKRFKVVETRGGFAVRDTLTGAMHAPWRQQTDAEIEALKLNSAHMREFEGKSPQ